MSPRVLPAKIEGSDIYHDIYDFSMFPVSLGDIITWGVKSALRADAAGRRKVHVHLICDPEKSGFSPLQTSTYLVDLFVVEAMPAFYSHPYFSGLSVYRSREDFEGAILKIAKDDEVTLKVYQQNEDRFKERTNFDLTCRYFNTYCSYHEEINACYRKTGTFPKVGYLKDCLVDWHALQAQFPKETFWVTLQFRLRKLDSGMPVLSDDGLHRDAPFLTWYNFIAEAAKLHPSVRFVLLGRLQEKPLELLRLPNVMALRTLGMNLGHEITALLNSDFYMGSPSGFAQAAHFSDVPYDIFNCTAGGCQNYGIPYGTAQLPNATERQRLHYELEEAEALLGCLNRALRESPPKSTLPGKLEINRTRSTDRFFINDSQSEAELATILSSRLAAIAFSIERGEYSQAQGELSKLGESFPQFVSRWPDYEWLSGVLEVLLRNKEPAHQTEAGKSQREELLAQVSRYCHPSRLIRRSGRYFDNLFSSEGFRRDGWCERKTRLVFAPSNKGDFLIVQIARLAAGEPLSLSVRINGRKEIKYVLVNEPAVLEIPITDLSIPTEIVLETDKAFKINSRDEKEYAFQIEGAGLVSRQTPMPGFFRGDKKDLREKIASGIYSNGAASNLARIRIDNPLSEEKEIAVHVIAHLPRSLRKGQCFRIQINDEEAHEAFISGKHCEVYLPCRSRSRHVSILMQFWNRNGSEAETKENRAMIKNIDIVPATGRKADIRSGYRGALSYLVDNLRSKINKKLS
jgi:hypothetical protein